MTFYDHKVQRQQSAAWATRHIILFIMFTLYPIVLMGEIHKTSFRFEDANGNEFNIQQLAPETPSQLLAVWFVEHDEHRPRFDAMLDTLAQAGIEVWRVDLLNDLFLPHSHENARSLPGEPVARIIETALERFDGEVLLVSYDRMALPLLRGLRLWQASGHPDSQLLGAALFYPNLFGPPPPAGQPPSIDPVVAATNYPLIIFQPEFGSHRWRIRQIMETFWKAGAPALFYRLSGIRDWFFMNEETQEMAADAPTLTTTRNMPALLKQASTLLKDYHAPSQPNPLLTTLSVNQQQSAPRRVDPPFPAPTLKLPRYPGTAQPEAVDFNGKVTVVVFWATWCPPCVEEMPSLNRLRQHFDRQPFQIVSVNFQEPPKQIEHFLQKVPVTFPILLDLNGSTSAQWNVFSFPSAFIIDTNGHIRFSVNHAIDWDTEAVRGLIDTLLPPD